MPSTKRVVDISNLPPENLAFADQSLAKAYAICNRVMAEYFSASSEGKLGSIRRNRNNWKMDAATECVDLIYQLDQQLKQDSAQVAK